MYFEIFEGTNKHVTGGESNYSKLKYDKNIQIGLVVNVDDPTGMGRIKVKLIAAPQQGGDNGELNADLPWCFPLLPKHLNIQPKVNEAVLIFLLDKNKPFENRMFLGPINSQPHLLKFDPYFSTAMAGLSIGNQNPDQSIANIPELKSGVFPKQEDISIQGRFNTDITQKENEIILRAGKFEISDNPKNPYKIRFNAKTQAYIQIKNDVILSKSETTSERGSVTNIVSNKINLLTHKDGSPKFNLTDPEMLITDAELEKILAEAHQLPFGDILLQYLTLLKDAVFNHVHNGNGKSATDLTSSGNKQALATFKEKADDLEKSMLSKNIRIN